MRNVVREQRLEDEFGGTWRVEIETKKKAKKHNECYFLHFCDICSSCSSYYCLFCF